MYGLYLLAIIPSWGVGAPLAGGKPNFIIVQSEGNDINLVPSRNLRTFIYEFSDMILVLRIAPRHCIVIFKSSCYAARSLLLRKSVSRGRKFIHIHNDVLNGLAMLTGDYRSMRASRRHFLMSAALRCHRP